MNDPSIGDSVRRSSFLNLLLVRQFGAAFVGLALSLSGTTAYGLGWRWDHPLLGNSLYALWGRSGSDVFAVGLQGAIVHYDGHAWSVMSSGSDRFLGTVWGSSGNDVFVGGDSGTILHYNGSGWSAMTSGTNHWVLGLWGSSSSNVFAVCGAGRSCTTTAPAGRL